VFILENLEPVAATLRNACLAIGNFDGVHLGHGQLIRDLSAMARALDRPAIALTFDPPPTAILRPESLPEPLTTLPRRIELLHEAGADQVGVFRTGRWLLELTAREFFDRVILGQFQAQGVVEGPTFGFGRDRAGNVATLALWCGEAGLAFQVASPVEAEGLVVSSSRIRRAIEAGEIGGANRMLGRPHRSRGIVVRGQGRGAGLGFATANLAAIETLVPGHGVYAALAYVDDDARPRPSAVHVGPNATFGEFKTTVEVHLIDFHADLYGRKLTLDWVERLRGSQRFDDVEALLAQMRQDVDLAREIATRAIAEANA
jgi:riboflavin kinase/FMN adenylyltransferase